MRPRGSPLAARHDRRQRHQFRRGRRGVKTRGCLTARLSMSKPRSRRRRRSATRGVVAEGSSEAARPAGRHRPGAPSILWERERGAWWWRAGRKQYWFTRRRRRARARTRVHARTQMRVYTRTPSLTVCGPGSIPFSGLSVTFASCSVSDERSAPAPHPTPTHELRYDTARTRTDRARPT